MTDVLRPARAEAGGSPSLLSRSTPSGFVAVLPGVLLLGKAEARRYIDHHARGGWRDQFAAWRQHRDFNG